MRVLIAGGVFRLSEQDRRARQAAPEIVLSEGLRAAGVDVRTSPLEDWRSVALASDCDVVHVHHLSKAALASALVPRARPFVFTEHMTVRYPARSLRAAHRVVLARAARVVCLSEAEAEAKRAAFGLAPARLAVIPNGIAPWPDGPRRRTLGPREPVTLLFVGQLDPIKQVHRAIEALAALPRRFVLRLVYHRDALRAPLRELARELGVDERVTFAGQRAGAALAREYQQAHVLVLPSASEALPSVVTEALLTGLPVLASAVGGVPGQVRDAGLLVTPDPADSLAAPLTALTGDYDRYAAAAFDRARTIAAEFTVERMVDRHIALYRSLRGGRR
ncbi:glycosyltransferase family 4 protein [Actinoplanes sp. N902-109]|uniref:glycosyltransferase family 4 protein n=1 Tax=Actinoplanes sp. (strain N902-109) TaxID=649831 RepID=UPI0003295998|nr:glycosyltransferase family 4 protein [Actinoplanes sp. N902-109]AGL16325.1 glycosyl transferase group 1 [Actinoplanes sp. N902-109]